MECNKDEAMRAKEIAIKKFTEQDYTSARKFALKAQTLYPPLEGISQMLSTINVYISADNRSGGEKDYYGILNVNPLADDDTIKKQYRKLVLQLHPDKNKSIGADGAFLFVSEAFNILSDKSKRSAYNTTRHIKIAQKVTTQTHASFRPFDLKVPAQQKPPSGTGTSSGPFNWPGMRQGPSSGGFRKEPEKVELFVTEEETFWTLCGSCKMQYEYVRIYLGRMLKCPKCSVGFKAVEIPPPSNMAPLKNGKVNPGMSGVNISVDGRSTRWRPFPGNAVNKESLKRGRKSKKKDGSVKKVKRSNGFVPAVAL